MTNREYFENVVNSNLDDDAKSLALTVLVNSHHNKISGKSNTPKVSPYGFGCQNERVDVRASLIAMLFTYLVEHGECRCKDIAKLYNEYVGVPEGNWNAVSYHVVAGITTPLVAQGIIKRVKKQQKITVETVTWINGERVTLSKDILVDVPYFQLV
jgi:hypothetical protein